MSRLLEEFNDTQTGRKGWWVECPACECRHLLWTDGADRPNWTFDGNMDAPTFTPSLLVRWTFGEERAPKVCHSHIRAGRWHYLNDCTHALAGQTVPMVPVEDAHKGER